MSPNHIDPPRVALVGASGYARIYLDYLIPAHDAGKLSIRAAVVLPEHRGLADVERLRERSVRIHGSFGELLDEQRGQLDLCFLPTGIHWHARMAIASMEAGANVLVEKPLAGSLADAEAVRACERSTGRWVAVGFQDIYTSENIWLKQQLIEGRIGKVKDISVVGLWPRPRSYYTRNAWAGRLFADGAAVLDSPLNNAFAHFINLALFLAAPSSWDSAGSEILDSELLRAHDIESFDTAVVRARSTGGVDFWFGVSHACREIWEPELAIHGERGGVEWRHEGRCTIHSGQESIQVVMPKTEAVRTRMFESVLARLNDPDVPVCNTAIASRHTALIEAIHEGARVRTVGRSMIEWFSRNGGLAEWPSIRGLEHAMRQACRRRCSLAEAGLRAAAAP